MSQPFVGEIRLFGFNFNPRGWSLAQGQTLGISQQQALFALLGTTYGGNGTSTFQLPNLASRVAVGQGQGPGLSNYTMGEIKGTETTSILINNLPSHNHPLAGAPAVSTTVTIGTIAAAGSAPRPGGNILAKGVDATTGTTMSNYAPPPSDGSALAGVTATSTGTLGTLAVGLTGSNIPVSILQPLLALNYCIALVGIFPSRS